MLQKLMKLTVVTATLMLMTATVGITQNYDDDSRYEYNHSSKEARIDRYLDVVLWTNHEDGEYFEGDNIVIKYRSNHDAFVAIYSIDTKGRVNLLFPSEPREDNFIRGGVSYRLPDGYDDYDLVVSGPEGIESIQVIASREKFPIPDWFESSDVLFDWDDRHEFMDYLNQRYFVRYNGQKFAYDRATVYVNEWEPTYFRPVYSPDYPSWTLSGNMYVDYLWGSSVYINGVYWGVTPLYVPRIYVGWHTMTIYDNYGYCWESDFHVTRYHTVILNRDIIHPRPGVHSKFKEVRTVGYRNPAKYGYPNYKKQVSKMKTYTSKTVAVNKTNVNKNAVSVSKNYVRGNSKLVKTNRGYETTGISTGKSNSKANTYRKYRRNSYDQSKSKKTRSKSSYSSGKSNSADRSIGETSRKNSTSSRNSRKSYKANTSKKSPSKATKVKTKTKKSSSSSGKSIKRSTQSKSSENTTKSSKSSGKSKREKRKDR